MLCHKSTSGYRNSFHRLLLRSTFSRNLSTRFDFLPLFSFPLSFSRNHRANFVPDISPSPLLIFHSIEFERSGIETLAKYKRIVREMLEQLLHRTKRTISSDQRIADPRNVATQHNVAVLCVETKAGRRPVGEKEKAEKKKESCKIRSKTPRSLSLLSVSFDPSRIGKTRCIPIFLFLYSLFPPKNMAKNRVILILRREGNYATRILFFNR